jgi:hypothetical protein
MSMPAMPNPSNASDASNFVAHIRWQCDGIDRSGREPNRPYRHLAMNLASQLVAEQMAHNSTMKSERVANAEVVFLSEELARTRDELRKIKTSLITFERRAELRRPRG